MRILDFFILLVLLVTLGLGLVFLWYNIPNAPGHLVKYQEFNINKTESIYRNGTQFYPNMRYKDRIISYSISDSCDVTKKKDVQRAFSFISEKTIVDFRLSNSGEIKVLCSDINPKPEERGHFVAGEGGPSEIINTTNYAIILSGKVSLYRRTSECTRPNVAIHEILHALGFDHNNNPKSIMYPITECDQILDNYIINEINKLYKADSLPDLTIEKLKATKTGRYLSFEITIGNFGLDDSLDSNLIIYAKDVEIKKFPLENIDIGTRKILNVENLRTPLNTDLFVFEVNSNLEDLDKENNRVEINLVKME